MLNLRIGSRIKDWTIEKKLYSISLVFLSIFFIVPNNKILLLITSILLICLYLVFKNLTRTCLYAYMLMLPFQNGKGMEFLVVPSEYVYGDVPFIMTPTITMSFLIAALLYYGRIRHVSQARLSELHTTFGTTDVLLGIFFVSGIFSSYISEMPVLSFILAIQIWGYILVYYYIIQCRLQSTVREFLLPILSSLVLYEGFWSALQYLNKGTLGTWAENSIDPSLSATITHVASEDISFARMQGTFSHPNFLGYFMAFTLPLLLYASLSKRSSIFMQYTSAVGVVAGIIGLGLSASRASWIVAAISLIIVFGRSDIRKSLHVTLIIRRFYLGFALLCSLVFPFIIIPRLSQLAITFNSSGGAIFRWELIGYSIRILLQHPFGVGLGMFPKILLQDIGGFTSFPTQPHNLFAQIFSAFGYLGGISFMTFLYIKLRSALATIYTSRVSGIDIYQYIYRSMFLVFLLLSMFYPILTEQQLFGWFWILLTIII